VQFHPLGGNQRGAILSRFLVRARPTLITLLLLVAVLNVLLLIWCRRSFALPGAIPVHIAKGTREIYFHPGRPLPPNMTEGMLWGDRTSPSRRKMQQEIAPVIAGKKTDLERAVALRQWVRTQCKRLGPEIEQRSINEPLDMLAAMRAGYSSQCGPMAYVYREALAAAGIPARLVILLRNPPFPSDGHGTVEAYLDGRWVLTDPTFNAHWTIDGRPANAWYIRGVYLFDPHKKHKLEVVNGEYVPDPSVETYQIRYYAQMNTILWEFYPEPYVKRWKLQRYPFTKLLQRNFMTIEDPRRETVDVTPFHIYNYMVWIVYVWLPAAVVLLAALVALSFVRRPAR
jgi:hypothetical protein